MKTDHLLRWRKNFFAGLAIILPAVISLWVIIWLFFTVSKITDTLLIFLPKKFTHEVAENGALGDLFWYWRLVALLLAVFLVTLVGVIARNYFGQKLIEWFEEFLLRVPFFNKIYGATRQVNDAFSAGGKNSFKTVVMVEFPRPGMCSLGFLTGEVHQEFESKLHHKVVCVFIPTSPNPTAGFLVLLPEKEVTKLDMSVADGFKFIVSLGSISPETPFFPPPKPVKRH